MSKATTAAEVTKEDIARGYREGTFRLNGKDVPNYHVVDADGKDTGHASLDPHRASELARIVRRHRAAAARKR